MPKEPPQLQSHRPILDYSTPPSKHRLPPLFLILFMSSLHLFLLLTIWTICCVTTNSVAPLLMHVSIVLASPAWFLWASDVLVRLIDSNRLLIFPCLLANSLLWGFTLAFLLHFAPSRRRPSAAPPRLSPHSNSSHEGHRS